MKWWLSAVAVVAVVFGFPGTRHAMTELGERLAYRYGLGQAHVWTQHGNNLRNGLNDAERRLTAKALKSKKLRFSLLFSREVDDNIYAQPLYLRNVPIPGQGLQNVVFVATTSNVVYAFDADDPKAAAPLWQVNLNFRGEMPVQNSDVGVGTFPGPYGDMLGNIGIIGTPVIDVKRRVLYVVTRSRPTAHSLPVTYRLFALDIRSGAVLPGWPVAIHASVRNARGEAVKFRPEQQNQRAALALVRFRPDAAADEKPQTPVHAAVFVAFGSYADNVPYHGWLIGYDAVTGKQVGAFNTTPNIDERATSGGTWGGGSIWQGGQGPAVDQEGNLYVVTGNGAFDPDQSNFGMSILKLHLNRAQARLVVVDFFAPYNWFKLNVNDVDLGSAGPMLLPEHGLVLGGGKEGWIYAVDKSDMGHLEPTLHATDKGFLASSRSSMGPGQILGSPVSWTNRRDGLLVYVWGANDVLRAFRREGKRFVAYAASEDYDEPDKSACTPEEDEDAPMFEPGAMLSVSADGDKPGTGVIWASLPVPKRSGQEISIPGRLIAFDATPIDGKLPVLWRSDRVEPAADGRCPAVATLPAWRFAKFGYPTVVNGKVYLATFSNRLLVFGLEKRESR
jgi:hypothetical protein